MPNKRRAPVRKRSPDRRVLRTRKALGAALVELMRERNFHDISVDRLLTRAGVGRATFYAHFRDKHDLLFSDAERFLELFEEYFLAHERGRRVAPVAELFSHVAEFAWFERALGEAGLRDAIYDLFMGHLARMIERRLDALDLRPARGALSHRLMSRLFAGALIEMLNWWTERDTRPDVREMDARFHELVWNGLRGASQGAGSIQGRSEHSPDAFDPG
jgi:AcrR family transcriptional regulator